MGFYSWLLHTCTTWWKFASLSTNCPSSRILHLYSYNRMLLICLIPSPPTWPGYEASWCSGIAKAGPGRARARPKFVLLMLVPLMCAQALVLLVQWLSIQQVPGQYQWPGTPLVWCLICVSKLQHNTLEHCLQAHIHATPGQLVCAIH